MATHAPILRQPFAPLDNPRLLYLASAKNRQNGLIAQKSPLSDKKAISPNMKSISLPSPSKRLAPTTFDDFDSENVDPAFNSSRSKKSKHAGFDTPIKPFTFSLTPAKSMAPPSRTQMSKANVSSPRAPMTAPAGRSPQRKPAGINKTRRVSAPFMRIDPPLFGSSRASSALPFSLDAALSGTLSTAKPERQSAGATIQESMPKNWFFDVYEDTPEEEAGTLMEHSTLTLDLSSDDESSRKAKDDRGKENTPPEGYYAPTASRAAGAAAAGAGVAPATKKIDIVRKKIVRGDDMDDGERSPLSDLETDSFIPEGLDKDSHAIVDAMHQKEEDVISQQNFTLARQHKLDLSKLFAIPAPSAHSPAERGTGRTNSLLDLSLVNAKGDVKGDVIIWEDEQSAPTTPMESPFEARARGVKRTRELDNEENDQPVLNANNEEL